MLQIDFLEEILKRCRECGIHTAVDTAGDVPYEYFERILPYTDLFLYDVKCYDSDLHRKYTGVKNDRILKNLKSILKAGASVWVRIPVIPEVNDSEEELQAIKRFLDGDTAPVRVELLPYHAMGEHKYQAIGKEVQSFSPPSADRMEQLKKIFEY